VLTIEDASTPRATTPVAGAERPGRGRDTRQSQSNVKTTPGSTTPGFIEIVDFFDGIEPGTSRSPMRALTHSDPTAEGVDAIVQRQRRMFRNRRVSVVSVDVRPVPSGGDSENTAVHGEGSSSHRERVMAVVLGNLHATAQGPTDDDVNGDVQFMHTFVLERGRRPRGDTADARDDENLGDFNDQQEQFAIVDEVFRRVDPVGDARAPGGLAAGAASLLRAAQSPPPTRGGGRSRAGRRDGDDETGTSDGETSSSRGEKGSPKIAENGGQTPAADGPEDGGDSPESTKTRKTPPVDDGLDDSVDEADVWLTNPMYGDVPESYAVPRDAQTEGHDTQTETPRAVRRAPGSAEVVPESPAINFASPNPFEDEAEGGGGGGVPGAPKRGADGGARGARSATRPMSPDANSIPFPSRSLLGANGPHVQNAPRANGARPNSGGESRLNRVSRRYSHEFEDAGTRRTLFDESPYVNRGRGNRRAQDDFDDDFEDDDDEEEGFGGAEGAEDAEDAEHTERRARRKERSVAGPPSSRYRRRVYSSASSSPAMSHAAGPTSAAPSPGFEPGTSGFDRNASPAAKRGLNARFQYDAQPWASAESEGVGVGVGVGDGVGVGAAAAASPSGRVGPAPGPRALEPMARSPRLVTLTERSDEGSTAASMRESASVTESAVNSDSERGSTRSGATAGRAAAGVLSDEEDRGSLRAHPVAEDAEILDWEDVRGYPAPNNRPNPSAASPDPVGPRSSSRVRHNGYNGQSRGYYSSRDSHNGTRRSQHGDEYGDAGVNPYPRSTHTLRGPPPVRYGYRSSHDDVRTFGDGGYAGVGGYSQPGSRSSSRGSARSSRGFVSRSHAGMYGGFDRGGGYDGVAGEDSFRRSSLVGSMPRGGRSAPPSPSMGATRAREFGVRDRTPRVRLSSAAGGLRGSYRRDDYDFAAGAFEFHPPRSSANTTPGNTFEESEQPPQLEDAVNYLGMLTAALHFTAAVVVFGFLLVAVYANGSAMTSLSKRLDRLDGAIVAGPASGNLGGVGGWGGGGGGGGGARMPKVGASVFGGSVVDVSGDAKAATAAAAGGGESAAASRRSAPKIVDLDSDEL